MKAQITKIHPLKGSKTEYSYIRVEFKLDSGKWAKTDLVPKYRNFKRWKPIIDKGEGVFVGDIRLKKDGTVDADSLVKQVFQFEVKEEEAHE